MPNGERAPGFVGLLTLKSTEDTEKRGREGVGKVGKTSSRLGGNWCRKQRAFFSG